MCRCSHVIAPLEAAFLTMMQSDRSSRVLWDIRSVIESGSTARATAIGRPMKYTKSYETQPLNPASEVHSLTSSKQQKQAEVRYGNERLSLQSCREIALDIVFPPTQSHGTTMECLLRPTDRDDNRLPALVKIPYVAGQRWDGGPFLTYPLRKGLPGMYFGAGGSTEHPW